MDIEKALEAIDQNAGQNAEQTTEQLDSHLLLPASHSDLPAPLQVITPTASKLGSLSYWDHHYAQELHLFHQTGDSGEIWFGEDREDSILSWCTAHCTNPNFTLLDLGCGNGHFLGKVLHRCNIQEPGRLFGLDYSAHSLQLANAALGQHSRCVQLAQADLLTVPMHLTHPLGVQALDWPLGTLDYVVDKGTFDAISLMPSEADREDFIQREIVPKYLANVCRFMGAGSQYILVTCNWTLQEVEAMFLEAVPCFRLVHVIPPSRKAFSFGGVAGNSVSIGVFRLVMEE